MRDAIVIYYRRWRMIYYGDIYIFIILSRTSWRLLLFALLFMIWPSSLFILRRVWGMPILFWERYMILLLLYAYERCLHIIIIDIIMIYAAIFSDMQFSRCQRFWVIFFVLLLSLLLFCRRCRHESARRCAPFLAALFFLRRSIMICALWGAAAAARYIRCRFSPLYWEQPYFWWWAYYERFWAALSARFSYDIWYAFSPPPPSPAPQRGKMRPPLLLLIHIFIADIYDMIFSCFFATPRRAPSPPLYTIRRYVWYDEKVIIIIMLPPAIYIFFMPLWHYPSFTLLLFFSRYYYVWGRYAMLFATLPPRWGLLSAPRLIFKRYFSPKRIRDIIIMRAGAIYVRERAAWAATAMIDIDIRHPWWWVWLQRGKRICCAILCPGYFSLLYIFHYYFSSPPRRRFMRISSFSSARHDIIIMLYAFHARCFFSTVTI